MQNKFPAVIISFLFFSFSVVAQEIKPLVHFNGLQTGKIIRITFVIRGGCTCDGVKILRSANSKDFTEIGHLTGVCGSAKDETYSFTDIAPVKNADNYYRLDLVNLASSEIIKIHLYDYGEKGYLLSPNPVKDKSILYFQNDCNEEFDFLLFDKKGKKVKQVKSIRGNQVEIEKAGLKGGSYTFQLLVDDEVRYNGNLLVL